VRGVLRASGKAVDVAAPGCDGRGRYANSIEGRGEFAVCRVSQKVVGAVNSFSIDQTTGVLKLLQTLDGGNPSQMVVDSTGNHLYASDTAFKGVSVYAIDQTSGSLGPPVDVPAGDVPGAIAIVQLH
jgi:6-phosphogluconolactonase (cycloisomerase 2 family)